MMRVSIYHRTSELSEVQITQIIHEVFRRTRRRERGAVAIRFVSERDMTMLNRSYRGKNRSTDVLSFSPLRAPPLTPPLVRGGWQEWDWGDIVICRADVVRNAQERGISTRAELHRIIAHGMLHLLGYDHATKAQEKRMFGIQEKIVRFILDA